METKQIPLRKLKNNSGQIEGLPKNPRQIRDEKYKLLLKSIQDDPEMLDLRELIVFPFGKDYIVIGGNMRLRAMQELKYTEAPCKVLNKNTTIEKLKAYSIKDNNSFGEYDWDLISNEWDVTDLKDWGTDIPVFSEEKSEPHEDDFDIPDIEDIKTEIVLGDYFEIGQHKLFCGDATKNDSWEKLKIIKNQFCCFTSPPYNMSKNAALVGNKAAAKRKSLYLQNDDTLVDYDGMLMDSLKNALKFCEGVAFNVQPLANNKIQLLRWILSFSKNFNEIITWNKSQAQPAMAQGVCSSAYEWIVFFSHKKTRTIPLSSWRGSISNVYNAPPQRNNKNAAHIAATFPMHLPSYIISEIMNLSKGVVDSFIGSGTTMVAAHQLNKACYGIEISPGYCQIIIDRMLKLVPDIVIKKNGILMEKKQPENV